MATDKDPNGLVREGEPAVQAKPQQVPAKCAHQVVSAASLVAPQASAPAVTVVAKLAKPIGASAHAPKPVLGQVANIKPTTAPGRTVLITVPRSSGPPMTHLPTNIQIPAGMVLIRSESGQLMLMSQQALTQAQQGARLGTGPATGTSAPPAPTAVSRGNEKATAPPAFQPPANQKTATVKVLAVTPKSAAPRVATEPRAQIRPVAVETKEPKPLYSQETLESVKKCKNFLVTLMKLASSDSKSADMANNVRGLVRSLLEGELEAEEFTEALYQALKSTPQPCLVPFLKKSLPAVRRLTADPQVFIQQACGPAVNKPGLERAPRPRPFSQASSTSVSAQSRILTSNSKSTTVQTVKKFTGGGFAIKQPFSPDLPRSTKPAIREISTSYNLLSSAGREDDDINDVPSMAGVNLREENARNLTGAVGSVVQSCQDQLFLSPGPALGRMLCTGRPLGVTEVVPEAVALVSHATQECLRSLLERVTVVAEHRKVALKEDRWHDQVSDTRSQLRFLEEVEALKKKRKDLEEREWIMRLARSRSHAEDPLQQLLKRRVKEMQQKEEAQAMQRDANLAALAAIGPRKKRPFGQPEGQVSSAPRQAARRPTRVILRDLVQCMEHDRLLRHSLALYKAML
ncbi:transcription initiation factor TFIID subunit 4-like isoform X2 [Corythoichthys intestinalis]|uniref:transcription initiation factor TFIID subunit 4-like isoform X2 n=1 Tax=Corythoichthys intestinalis TaxID=161448 RepID=UPI0025A66D5D|nr:transcription initiation factor TFIID subunit 4-like isoform X2 [Corythoichthys intestinalis]